MGGLLRQNSDSLLESFMGLGLTMVFRSILITGASSGIGAALAGYYAAGGARLALLARDRDRLAAVSANGRKSGGEIVTALCDVRDRLAMARQITAWDDERPFDLVIANAGISAGNGENEEQLRAITATNIDGVINSVSPLLSRLIARRHGHIGLMASLAGYRGLPGAPAYCASKAWVKTYGESLRYELAEHNVGVSVICPGFITTPMTANNRFPMPFSMPASKAAAIIARQLAANRALIAFPAPMALAAWALSALPQALFALLARHMPKK